LVGHLLDNEVAQIDKKINKDLEHAENLTLALLKQLMDNYNINGGLKTYIETQWISVYEEFVDDIYILAFFLHPDYKRSALKHGQFHFLVLKEGIIWQGMGKSVTSYEILVTQLWAHHRLQKVPYNLPYISG
ncbi:8217_t:CDS:2, partial [Entrophospora sp. SA101]